MVESHSFRPDLGEALTEAICKQIEKETPYKVVGSPNADSILTAKIDHDTKRVIVLNKFDEPQDTEVNYQVQVTWINRKGDQIYNGAVPLPPEFTTHRPKLGVHSRVRPIVHHQPNTTWCKRWRNRLWA